MPVELALVGEFAVNPVRHVFHQSLTHWLLTLLFGRLVVLYLSVPRIRQHHDEWPDRAELLWPLYRREPQDYRETGPGLVDRPRALLTRPIHFAFLLHGCGRQ